MVWASRSIRQAFRGTPIHYYEGEFGSFFTRAVFDKSHPLIDEHHLDLIVSGDRREEALSGRRRHQSIQPALRVEPQVDPKRMLIGTQYLYESFDREDHLDGDGGAIMVRSPRWA